MLKGIEYDTRDAGHILVIMPEGVKMRLLEMRGMPLAVLIDLVHRNGGRARTCASVRGEVYEFYECAPVLPVAGDREAV